MDIKKLDEQYRYREENMKIENKNKMEEILKNFFMFCKKNKIFYKLKGNIWDTFLMNYQNLCNHGLEKDIRLFMKSNGAKETAFLYEYLLSDINNLNHVSELNEQTGEISLEVENKKLLLAKADTYFENTEIAGIFKKKLQKECFDRTLELVSIIKDSEAIVSYLPNLFVGGYYHAYLKCKNGILIDPASNLVMLNDEAKQLLKGDIVFSLNNEQIIESLEQLKTVEQIELYERPKLLQLALFKECSEIEALESISHKRR